MRVRGFKESEFKKRKKNGGWLGGVSGGGGGVDGWSDEQAQTNLPLNFFEVGGITMH